jgi:hypothetical protein
MSTGAVHVYHNIQRLWNARCGAQAVPCCIEAGFWTGSVVHTDTYEVGVGMDLEKPTGMTLVASFFWMERSCGGLANGWISIRTSS